MNFFKADSKQLNFLRTMDYSPWSEREIWPFLRVAVSPKLEGSRPPKLVYMHVTSTPIYMNFFEPIHEIHTELKTDFTVGYILRHSNDIKTLHVQRIMAAIEI